MIRSRLRFKVLGLCVLALSLSAFSASAAQALPTWMVNGSDITTTTLLPKLGVLEVENKTATLLTKIAGALVHYLCTEADLIEVHLMPNGLLSNGKVAFLNCVTILNGSVSTGCAPHSAGKAAGTIETLKGKGEIALHEGQPVTKIEPETAGGNFAVIESNPETCALPEKVPVKGVLYLKDCKNLGATEEVKHLVEQNSLTHLFVISDTAEHAANIDGSAVIGLINEHAGLKWSALPA